MNYDNTFNYTPPQLNLNAGAEAFIKPELRMMIYNVVGPYINAKGYGKIEADLLQNPWWKMYYGLKMSAGAKVKILDLLLIDFTVGDLLEWEQQVGQATSGTIPIVSTAPILNITETTASSGGDVTSDGGETITARGVCWNTSTNPTISDAHTIDGTGTGSFSSNITGLTANTPYFVRAYATNGIGTAYGAQLSFTTTGGAGYASVTTANVTEITQTTATCGGDITNSGGSTVTSRGVCWSTTIDPNISDAHTTDGSGMGSFISNITELTANTTYNVRAYATNSTGTAYGEQISFTTIGGGTGGEPCPGIPFVNYEGKTYNTVQIGTQCWFKENLNIGTRINGSEDQNPSNGIKEKYCYDDLESNCDTYGGLYQWNEMMQGSTTPGVQGLCPTGWHIPTDDEWTTLTEFLGGISLAGGKMKSIGTLEAGTGLWFTPNAGATNESGFTALPGGYRYTPQFQYKSDRANIWSSTEIQADGSSYRMLYYDDDNVLFGNGGKQLGFSVRCLKD